MKSNKINSILIHAFEERGMIKYGDDCKKLDLHWYYENEPATIEIEDGRAVLYIRLKMYSMNSESFINHKFYARLLDLGFQNEESVDIKYQHQSMLLTRIYHHYGVIDMVRQEFNQNKYLQVSFYFIVVRKNVLDNLDVDFNVAPDNCSDTLCTLSYMSANEQINMIKRLKSHRLKFETDFIHGCYDYLPGTEAEFYENNWLKFKLNDDGQLFVRYFERN
jgi:hypothetical protein